MPRSIALDISDPHTIEQIHAEARRRGSDVNAVVADLLANALQSVARDTPDTTHRTIADLAGTWSDQEADAFLAAVAGFNRVEEEMWP